MSKLENKKMSQQRAAFSAMSVDELKEEVMSLKKNALSLRFQRVNGHLESTSLVRKTRRNTAKALTFLNMKQKAQGAQESKPQGKLKGAKTVTKAKTKKGGL